ncbi:helix-hairpin-helix domain-containing protein [Paenibacillus thiaminolyticus]|uniref:Helix-hairpin-helix domain-containing protein n=1 Tax=Paenibacillus thiaminolyticus TaxID=49283 RepID=A0A3A3GM48_PANTH|nr:helix-hairpin-helix domain-containing protein [Paenibacillus thiaminolyticus]RJG26189.1 helix-hairpin-helix domain-containing protein [Paenibacillus thiaminolyticus]
MKKSRHALSLRAWIGLTGMAIAGLAIFMGLWLKPQSEEAAGGWTPLNEAIAGRLAAGEEGQDMGERSGSANPVSASSFPAKNSGREEGRDPASNSGQSVNPAAGDPNQLLTMQPDKKQAEPNPGEQGSGVPASAEASTAAPSADAKAKDAASGRININAADAEALMKLPGIGPSKSQAIVKYRESHGPFQRLEDLKKVKGIGPAIFAKLRDQASIE